MKRNWWKIVGVILLSYTIVGGFLMAAPENLGILQKTIRNLYFHVPMWFTMITLLLISYIYSIKYLSKQNLKDDRFAESMANAAMLFGILGLVTGSFWARFTWTVWWTPDPKLNGAAIGMMIYAAYYILRKNMDDERKRAKFSAVYNLFAFPIFIVLIIVLPKLADSSLHPGSGDTVGFNEYELDDHMRMVFYPAVIGWILLGSWIATLRYRIATLKHKNETN
ncbi:MAG: cytochrome c biogenesis protein CcsA [Bacteroidia bacterium]